jgi:hypothetical protein
MAAGRASLTVVAEQKVLLDAVYRDWPHIVPLEHEVEARVSRVEQTLHIERLEVDDLETLGAAHAELGLEKVDRARLGGDVELLRKRRQKRSQNSCPVQPTLKSLSASLPPFNLFMKLDCGFLPRTLWSSAP